MKRMNHVYPKLSVTLLALAVSTAFLATGCKKSVTRSSSGMTAAQQGITADSDGDGSGGNNGKGGDDDDDQGGGSGTPQVSCVIKTVFGGGWRANAAETITFACSHNKGKAITSVQCQLNTGAWGACSGAAAPYTGDLTHAVSGLTDGPQAFRVKATAEDGRSATSLDLTWSVDRTPPVFQNKEVVSKTPTSATFSFNATDSGVGMLKYECKLSTQASWADCVSHHTVTGLTAGTAYTFQVRAYDKLNNVTATPAELQVTTPTGIPDGSCVITSAIPVWLTVRSLAISFKCSSTGGISAVECRNMGPKYKAEMFSGNFDACATFNPATGEGTHTLTELGDGTHTFEVRFRDGTGTPGSSATASWKVDAEGPTVQIKTPDTSTLNASIPFEGTYTGAAIAYYKCRLETAGTVVPGADWDFCTTPAKYNVESGKPYTFSVKAWDEAGNESKAATYSWISDPGYGPGCQVLTKFDTEYRNKSEESISFSCSSPAGVKTRECQLNGAVVDCDSDTLFKAKDLKSGKQYEFRVRATDNYGNEGELSAPLSWKVDLDKPKVRVIKPAEVDHPNATIYFESEDEGGSKVKIVECKLEGPNGHGWTSCPTSPKSYSGLTLDANYKFSVRATDYAGNESDVDSDSFVEFTDKPGYKGPDCSLVMVSGIPLGPAGWTNASLAKFQVNCNPAEVERKECSGDGVSFANCFKTPGGTATDLVDIEVKRSGTAHYYARGFDQGKTGPISHQQWNVDLEKPTVTIDDLTFNEGTAEIFFSADDTGGSGLYRTECQMNGGAWTQCSSPARYADAGAPGKSFTFRVRAIDGANNVSVENAGTTIKSWTNGFWSEWSTCTAACDQTAQQTRTCTHATGGGIDCEGPSTQDCQGPACPIAKNNGWGEWGGCSASCGGGVKVRYCKYPSPDFRDSKCTKGQIDKAACNTQPCCVEKEFDGFKFDHKCDDRKNYCPKGMDIKSYRYTGTDDKCDWKTGKDTIGDFAQLKCCKKNPPGTHNVNHIFITCCQKP